MMIERTSGHSTRGSARRSGRAASQSMSPWPPAVAPESLATEAARLMTYLNLKRVFVVDGDALVGVLSQGDITDAVAAAKL